MLYQEFPDARFGRAAGESCGAARHILVVETRPVVTMSAVALDTNVISRRREGPLGLLPILLPLTT